MKTTSGQAPRNYFYALGFGAIFPGVFPLPEFLGSRPAILTFCVLSATLSAGSGFLPSFFRDGSSTSRRCFRFFAVFSFTLGLSVLASLLSLEAAGARNLGFSKIEGLAVRAELSQDAQIRKKGGLLVSAKILSVRDVQGRVAETLGSLKVLIPSAELLFTGDVVELRLTGASRDGTLFFGDMTDGRSGSGIWAWRKELLKSIFGLFQELGRETGGLCLALLMGRQDFLSDKLKNAFYSSGCAHLVALSGMHIAFFAGLVLKLLGLVFPLAGARVVSVLVSSAFVFVCGPFPSALRALLMFIAAQGILLTGYRAHALSPLFLANLLALILDPSVLRQTGYLLSWFALLGIFVFQEKLNKRLRRPLSPLLAADLSCGMAAQIFTIPVLLGRGLPWQPLGTIAGLPLAPLCAATIALSVLYAGLSVLLPPGLSFFNGALAAVLDCLTGLMAGIGGFFASLAPGISLEEASFVFGFAERI